MTMNPGMLLFGLFDSALAFLLVFQVTKAKLGGDQHTIARVVATILGTIVFIIYFGVIVWFNTDIYTVSPAAKMVVYLAPIVLSLLMTALVLLSAPPKKKEEPSEENPEETENEPEESR